MIKLMNPLETVISFLAPYQCLVCGQEGSLLCEWCQEDSLTPLPSRCYRCHALTIDSAVCDTCRPRTPLRNAWVSVAYETVAKDLLHHFKFERAAGAAGLIADNMGSTIPALPDDITVVHVPTATTRRRQRGYDQAELLAKQLARSRNLQHITLLRRSGQSRQVGATRKKREEQLEDSISVIKQSRLPKSVLLVDDIVTTGATIEAAARALKKAGVKKVYVAAFAQKL